MKVKLGRYPSGIGIQRKIDINIEKFDTWSLDSTLALIILPALIQLKQSKHGVPSEFVSSIGADMDRNYVFDFIHEDERAVFDKNCEKWEETFDKMIWSFQQIVDGDYDSRYHHGEFVFDWKKSGITYPNPITGKDEETYEMVEKNPDDHWYDHVGHMLHEERIQEGLELFGRYFRSLWD